MKTNKAVVRFSLIAELDKFIPTVAEFLYLSPLYVLTEKREDGEHIKAFEIVLPFETVRIEAENIKGLTYVSYTCDIDYDSYTFHITVRPFSESDGRYERQGYKMFIVLHYVDTEQIGEQQIHYTREIVVSEQRYIGPLDEKKYPKGREWRIDTTFPVLKQYLYATYEPYCLDADDPDYVSELGEGVVERLEISPTLIGNKGRIDFIYIPSEDE